MKCLIFFTLCVFISFSAVAQVSPAERSIKMKAVFVENYTLDHKSKVKISEPDKKNALDMASVKKVKLKEYNLFEDMKARAEFTAKVMMLEKNKSIKTNKE